MWIVVIYVCLVGGVCMFIDSPPVYSKQDCEAIKLDSEKMLDNDPRVVVYDNTCVHVKMNQVGELR